MTERKFKPGDWFTEEKLQAYFVKIGKLAAKNHQPRRDETPEYKADHRDYMKKYRQSERGKSRLRLAEQKRRSQKAAIPATFTAEDWKQTLVNFGGDENGCYCAYCSQWTDVIHQEHFIPLSRGGEYSNANILPACPSCNLSKSTKDPQDFLPPQRYQQLKAYLDRKAEALQLSFFATRST